MTERLAEALLWGLVASAAMITVLQASVGLGWSRLNLPMLIGTLFTGNRHRAIVLGMVVYLIGGWLFALLYFFAFAQLGHGSWWLGGLLGLLHGLFLVVVALPLLPHIHPRMASDVDGPTYYRRLEPPGPFGTHYGHNTPLTALLANVVYGVVLGAVWPFVE